jgi:hypothetical protein
MIAIAAIGIGLLLVQGKRGKSQRTSSLASSQNSGLSSMDISHGVSSVGVYQDAGFTQTLNH